MVKGSDGEQARGVGHGRAKRGHNGVLRHRHARRQRDRSGLNGGLTFAKTGPQFLNPDRPNAGRPFVRRQVPSASGSPASDDSTSFDKSTVPHPAESGPDFWDYKTDPDLLNDPEGVVNARYGEF
jgi:hypothetical protein